MIQNFCQTEQIIKKHLIMLNIIRFISVGLIAKLLHCAHIGWYSTRVTYVLVGEYQIDIFDTFLMVTIALFLLFMVMKSPKLEGKAKKAYLIIKIVFHVVALSYICYEGIHSHNYVRMFVGLSLYGLIELIILIFHHINDNGPPDPAEDKIMTSFEDIK